MYGIIVNYSPMYKAIVGNTQRNLEDNKGAWLEELPKVLWAQRTTKKIVIDESPFALVFRIEVVLPIEAGLPTLTTMVVENVEENQRQFARNLDLPEEVRECDQIRRVAYQQKARAFYDQKTKIRRFVKG